MNFEGVSPLSAQLGLGMPWRKRYFSFLFLIVESLSVLAVETFKTRTANGFLHPTSRPHRSRSFRHPGGQDGEQRERPWLMLAKWLGGRASHPASLWLRSGRWSISSSVPSPGFWRLSGPNRLVPFSKTPVSVDRGGWSRPSLNAALPCSGPCPWFFSLNTHWKTTKE